MTAMPKQCTRRPPPSAFSLHRHHPASPSASLPAPLLRLANASPWSRRRTSFQKLQRRFSNLTIFSLTGAQGLRFPEGCKRPDDEGALRDTSLSLEAEMNQMVWRSGELGTPLPLRGVGGRSTDGVATSTLARYMVILGCWTPGRDTKPAISLWQSWRCENFKQTGHFAICEVDA
ncbi:hypothetical protein P154DRAFT_366874 [Amniculicola lignicola CBS 123094]|uniref:Uncharacterized protein n=1 Tax=Amniculicola lignicola CBS 123094 TaxID=1392246 RepID=A0A6A5VYC3_9PLEO|nr:hypothetical protein P154DRAFT_366874 [Amniculicola lignicola CBS 123094]